MGFQSDTRAGVRVRRCLSALANLVGIGVLALLVATAGTGCGGGGGGGQQPSSDAGADTEPGPGTDAGTDTGPDAGPTTTPNEDNLLESGGLAVTEEMGILTTEGVLEKDIAVQSEPAPNVTDETPLPDWADPVGTPLRISASRYLDIPAQDDPAYLMLRVPPSYEGDPAKLEVATRTPRSVFAGDQLEGSTRHVWSAQPGYYIEGARVLIVPFRFFYEEGLEYSLVRTESASTLTLEFPERNFGADGDSETTEQGLYRTKRQGGFFKDAKNWVEDKAEDVADAFKDVLDGLKDEVKKAVKKVVDTAEEAQKCLDNGGLKAKPNFIIECRGMDCDDSMRFATRDQLKKIHGQFVSDFRKPDLKRSLPCRKIDQDEDGTAEHYGRFYFYELRDEADAAGKYLPSDNISFTRTDPGKNPSEATTRMEFFHAVQWNYPSIGLDWRAWVIEGTAEFIENTSTTPQEAYRHSKTLRKIDRSLDEYEEGNGSAPAYRAQDFWVYMINSLNSTPKEILTKVFKVQNVRKNSNPTLSKVYRLFDLRDLHWGWVRNQAFEASMTEGFGSKLGDTCVPNDGNDGNSKAWSSLKTTMQYDPSSRTSPLRKTLRIQDEWAAKVAKIELDNSSSSKSFKVFVSAEGNQPVKLYRDRDQSTQACLNRGEELRRTSLPDDLSANGSQSYYLLMENFQGNDEASFDVRIEHLQSNGNKQRPSARIVKPANGERVNWDNQTFEALAAAGNGGITLNYDWKVSHGSETVDDVDGDGDDTSDGNPVTLTDLPYDSSAYHDSITVELTVTDGNGNSVTVRETRGNLACRNLYEPCNRDSECCSGTCATSGGTTGCVSG